MLDDEFGFSVGISGEAAGIGAARVDDDPDDNVAAAYIFRAIPSGHSDD